MLVISPHLDDAVLSCGALLASHPGAVVATLFAGAPADADQRTAWDLRSGFDSAGQAVAARRREDAAALAVLGAKPHWLAFCDGQYGTVAAADASDALAAAIAAVIAQFPHGPLLLPMGLFHADHLRAHAAACSALAAFPARDTWFYEDVPYRSFAGLLQQRLQALADAGWQVTPVQPQADATASAAKAKALAAYASQLQAFGPDGLADAAAPERFWQLARPSP